MRNANKAAAVSRHGPMPAALPANRARRPRVLLTTAPSGQDAATAEIRAAASAVVPSCTAKDGRTGILAACRGSARDVLTRLAQAVAGRAAARRIADRELTYLSDHILADMGLTRGATDARLRHAARHGPRP